MVTPALRHETGELLAPNAKRIHAEAERAVQHPVPSQASAAYGVSQDASVFTGTTLGVGGAYGLSSWVEGQLSSYWNKNGAGWRLGFKFPALKAGAFSTAATVKYGTYAGSGSIETDTASTSTTTTMSEVVAANSLDLGFPVSYRVGATTTLYSGLALIKNWVKGAVDNADVTDISSQWVLNLGLRFRLAGNMDADLEVALVKLHDPFLDESRMLPFMGFGVGMPF